jgi:hypothetical protein
MDGVWKSMPEEEADDEHEGGEEGSQIEPPWVAAAVVGDVAATDASRAGSDAAGGLADRQSERLLERQVHRCTGAHSQIAKGEGKAGGRD